MESKWQFCAIIVMMNLVELTVISVTIRVCVEGVPLFIYIDEGVPLCYICYMRASPSDLYEGVPL